MKPISCPDIVGRSESKKRSVKYNIMAIEIGGPKAVMFLDELKLDETGTIIVMLCRMWDINASSGQYLSTDFLVSDSKVHA